VGFRENMDIKFLRPHEIIVTRDTAAGGVQAVANGSEAKIADSMLRKLHDQGVLGDAAADLRFNMRPGRQPRARRYGGVFEAFTVPGSGTMGLVNRFGEEVKVERAGHKADLALPLEQGVSRAAAAWKHLIEERMEQLDHALAQESPADPAWPPLRPRSAAARAGRRAARGHARAPAHARIRRLPRAGGTCAARSCAAWRGAARDRDPHARRAAQAHPRSPTSAASALQHGVPDRWRARVDGAPEGGLYRLLDQVPPIHEALATPEPGAWRHARLTLATRDDLCRPRSGARRARDRLAGFKGESFRYDSASAS
jgi:hypothetical protein